MPRQGRSLFRFLLVTPLMVSAFATNQYIHKQFDPLDSLCRELILPRKQRVLSRSLVDAIRANKVQFSNKDRGTIDINSKSYQAIGVLGIGQNIAYLGKDDESALVSIKETYSNSSFLFAKSYYPYDLHVSNYYFEIGLPVARVLDYEIRDTSAAMVKQYVHGITMDEIRINLPSGTAKDLEKKLKVTIWKFKIARIGFLPWMAIKKIKLSSVVSNVHDLLILLGDIETKNFVFSVDRNEWVLFDP